MNKNKICFISCVNNERVYEENLLYIENLIIPDGYEVETICIRDAKSMTSGYNKAMNNTDAKYKVYTHQDVVISNKNFISDMIRIFEKNPKLGLMGVIGTKQLPPSGNWWETNQTVGKVYENHTGNMKMLQFEEVVDDYEVVQALDGLILMTQYDVTWREDLFKGFHFYDISQCVEFKKAGWQVGIPKQENPWTIHDCGFKDDKEDFLVYEGYRSLFLDKYSQEVFPLVSILIPTYNETHYFKIALESAINQTYKNTEIIICDDSTTEDVKLLVESYIKDNKNIKYYNNGGPLGEHGRLNCGKCFELSQGEYISYLFHDDEYYPTKVERMIKAFMEDDTLTLVTSHRTLIDYKNDVIKDIWGTPYERDMKFKGEDIAREMLFYTKNIIGEPTTVIFKKEDINKDDSHIFDYYGNKMVCLGDISLFLKLASKGNVFFIKEHLSKFRMHMKQNTHDKSISMWAGVDFFMMIIESYNRKIFIKSEDELRCALQSWLRTYVFDLNNIFNYIGDEDKMQIIKKFKEVYYKNISNLAVKS